MNTLKTNLGYFLAVSSAKGLTSLKWQQMPFSKRDCLSDENQNVSHETIRQLQHYLSGSIKSFSLPLDLSNWSVEMQKWFKSLTLVDYGSSISYQQLAEKWGNKKATRAAGQACRRNPIPIIIPCHRIVSSNGSITQYSGGGTQNPRDEQNINRKNWLLNLEAHFH
jgi:methylated-DNA-[protein]-cysteine S-methyltransferase